MSIHGVPGSTILPPGFGSPNAASRAEKRPAAPAAASPAPASPAAPPPSTRDVPVQAPPGTDPELWNVLTAEERTFFAKLGAMGPLTYGRVLSGQLATPAESLRGGRVNVKV